MARILIAEDDVSMREFLVHAVGRHGHGVSATPDAEAALDLIGGTRFDLLLADIRLPGLDGIGLARAARRLTPGIGVMFVTGFPQDARKAGDLIRSRAQILSKPFPLRQLVAQIDQLLRH